MDDAESKSADVDGPRTSDADPSRSEESLPIWVRTVKDIKDLLDRMDRRDPVLAAQR